MAPLDSVAINSPRYSISVPHRHYARATVLLTDRLYDFSDSKNDFTFAKAVAMKFTENSGCIPTGKTVPIHINGRDIITNLTFDVLKPSTNEVLYQASAASNSGELTFTTRPTK